MPKTVWIIPALLLFAAISAPNAHADSSYDATFTCDTYAGCPPPIAPAVSFTAPPTLDVVLYGYDFFDVTLQSDDAPTDSYTWLYELNYCSSFTGDGSSGDCLIWAETFSITDTTRGDESSSEYTSSIADSIATGTLSFAAPTGSTSPVPEPSSLTLMLAGVALLFLLPKRVIRVLPQRN